MRKNKLMRLASLLLVLVLLTSSVISGTLAKYVMNASGSDGARVARFGVEISAVNDLFGNSYKGVETGNTPQAWGLNKVTASSVNKDLIVAPGTKSNSETLSVKGTAEVSTKLTFDTKNVSTEAGFDMEMNPVVTSYTQGMADIYLGNGIWFYLQPIEGTPSVLNETMYKETADAFVRCTEDGEIDANAKYYQLQMPPVDTLDESVDDGNGGTVVVDNKYYPLVWSITTKNGDTTETKTDLSLAGEADSVEAELKALFTGENGAALQKAPNDAWNLSATITWEWPFSFDSANYDVELDDLLPQDVIDALQEAGLDPNDINLSDEVKAEVLKQYTAMIDRLDTTLGSLIAWTQYRGLEGNNTSVSVPVIGYLPDNSTIHYDSDGTAEPPASLQRVHVGLIPYAAANHVNDCYAAWVGDKPADMTASNVVACLSASFAYTLTCEQVD